MGKSFKGFPLEVTLGFRVVLRILRNDEASLEDIDTGNIIWLTPDDCDKLAGIFEASLNHVEAPAVPKQEKSTKDTKDRAEKTSPESVSKSSPKRGESPLV